MADDDTKRKKRSRAEHNRGNNNPSFKKIHVDLEPSSNDSNDSPPPPLPTETGVFDFPWMKDQQGVMKSDDDEDAFASSLHATNVSDFFKDDDRLIVTTTTEGFFGRCDRAAMGRKEIVNDGDDYDDDDGLDCVWDSLLNQKPLSNIEFDQAGGFF